MEDRQRKSYQAFLKLFYPPRANQSQRQEEEEEEEEKAEQVVLNPAFTTAVPHGVCDFPEGEEEEEEEKNSSTESASERTAQNLTRSKRKRLRRMKLKQAASSRRRSIIGPLLPSMEETPHGVDNAVDESPSPTPLPETVIHNASAAEGVGAGNRDYPGEPLNVQKKKLKQRRLAKKLSRSTKACTIKEMEIPLPDMSPAQ